MLCLPMYVCTYVRMLGMYVCMYVCTWVYVYTQCGLTVYVWRAIIIITIIIVIIIIVIIIAAAG